MTFTVLSPYQVFFIDESEKLWTVLKDGRLRFIKQVPAFSCVSAGKNFICGVEFDGEHTRVIQTPFGFNPGDTCRIFSQFGYCYYPVLAEAKHPRMALLKADLLNPSGTADLTVFQRARTKFHPQFQLSAQIVPPQWGDDMLYYITAKGTLARTNGTKGEKLADSVRLFCLNANQNTIAYYDGESIYIVSLETGNTQKIMAFNVTAIGFNNNALYFAFSEGGTCGLYTYDRLNGEVMLISRIPAAAKIIS